jgi:hypothetical protein
MKAKEIREGYKEYNDEVGSVVTNLHTIRRMCDVLQKNLEADDNMAEWAQEKIAVTKSMIVTVTDYILSQKEQGLAEEASVGATASGNIATVANPHIAHSKKKPKKQKPTDNALDNKGVGLFGQPLKR